MASKKKNEIRKQAFNEEGGRAQEGNKNHEHARSNRYWQVDEPENGRNKEYERGKSPEDSQGYKKGKKNGQ